MNTVLDDNKKLCLSNGEIIKIPDRMNIMFEVEDLKEASPATISRCGMVFVRKDIVEWKVQLNVWIQNLPVIYRTKRHVEFYNSLIDNVIRPMIMKIKINKLRYAI